MLVYLHGVLGMIGGYSYKQLTWQGTQRVGPFLVTYLFSDLSNLMLSSCNIAKGQYKYMEDLLAFETTAT